MNRPRLHDPIGGHPYLSAPKLVRLLTLSGQFDEASDVAQTLWDSWVRDGSPAITWLSSALAAAALVHGLRDDGQYERWRSRSLTAAGCDDPTDCPDLKAIMAFVDARIAIHSGDYHHADTLVERADATFPERWWEGYARAAGAELAVVAGLPDAAYASPAPNPSPPNITGRPPPGPRPRTPPPRPRRHHRGAQPWEDLDARFEHACTLLLLPGREPEGRAELHALGCPSPAHRAAAT